MKKFLTLSISFFLLIQSVLFIVPITKIVYADQISDSIENISCGTYNNTCCGKQVDIDLKIPNLHMPFPFNLVNGAVSGIFNPIIRPVLNGFWGAIDQVIFRTILDWDIRADKPYCITGDPQTVGNQCLCVDERTKGLTRLCFPITNYGEKQSCLKCMEGGYGTWTGIGCLNTNLSALIREKIGGTFVGIGGAMALLCIMYAAFVLQTSRGNPERIKKAKEMLRACITGLLLIIFSVLILKIVGVDILRIPGFGN